MPPGDEKWGRFDACQQRQMVTLFFFSEVMWTAIRFKLFAVVARITKDLEDHVLRSGG
jgi:hypothetical protein